MGSQVAKAGGLSDEGVYHASIDMCGGSVIDKGDGRECWQVWYLCPTIFRYVKNLWDVAV